MAVLNTNFELKRMMMLDSRYGPYLDLSSALLAVPRNRRSPGLPIGIGATINTSNGDITPAEAQITEYWFKSGIEDADLIIKESGGGSVELSQIASIAHPTGQVKDYKYFNLGYADGVDVTKDAVKGIWILKTVAISEIIADIWVREDAKSGVLYVDLSTNSIYRWDGNNLIESTAAVGDPEIGVPYNDGIFKDITKNTPVGTTVSRFNKMFSLLAPSPPKSWATVPFSSIDVSNSQFIANTPRMINTLTGYSRVLKVNNPTFFVTNTTADGTKIGTGEFAKTINGTFTFTIKNPDESVIETTTISKESTTKSSGIIQYTIQDPYLGITGKAGFWLGANQGVTSFTASGTITQTLTAGVSSYTISFVYPDGTLSSSVFYMDIPITNIPIVNTITLGTLPSMTKKISGVPSLTASSTIPLSSFKIGDSCTYFYGASPLWKVNGIGILTIVGDIATSEKPIIINSTITINTDQSLTIDNTYRDSFSFTMQAKNRDGILGAQSDTTTISTLRYDPSDETLRLKNTGNTYNSTPGGAYDNTESAKSLIIDNPYELQLLNWEYRWPFSNYTNYGGPNYSSIILDDSYRWATFKYPSLSIASQFTLTIPGLTGNIADTEVYCKLGTTGWLNVSIEKPTGTPNNDGDGCLDLTGTDINIRNITLGTGSNGGDCYVRIGINSLLYKFNKPTLVIK